MIETLWNILSAAFKETPPWVGAILFGWFFSWGVTQSVKFFIPLGWTPDTRKVVAQALGFVSAASVVVLLKPLAWPATILLSTMVGFWSPLSWALLVAVVRKRWPFIADVLTQDTRGVLFGERRE